MRIPRFIVRGSPRAIAVVLALFTWFGATAFAATNWSAIQAALGANGTEFPGNVLRFELSRLDLTITVSGVTLTPNTMNPAIGNGFIGFKPIGRSRFFVDGSLPALDSELDALQTALRADKRIHITAIVNHATVAVTPKIIWVHFEANGDGAELANSLNDALKTIHSPQLGQIVIPGTNNVFDPSLLPPEFMKLFDQGFVEQFGLVFAFYLPRPDERCITIGPVKAETGLGIGQSFYIQIPFEGGTNNAILNIDFALRADEIQPVEDTLRAGGFTISAQNNWFVNESPKLYFVHASAAGDGFALGNTLLDVIRIIQVKSLQNHDHDHDWDD
jgi:Domain of Unknown Function (DUF1259)